MDAKLPTPKRQTTRVVSYHNSKYEYEDSSFLPILAICFLTFNSVVALIRAHAHGDYPMIAFLIFLYLGFMSLLQCLKAFDRLPVNEESRRKDCLKVAIWVLSTALNFGLAIKFAPLLYPVGTIFVFAMAMVSSGCGFYFFFIYRCDKKIKYFESSPLDGKISSLESSPLENV